jgi:hypothetical protein
MNTLLVESHYRSRTWRKALQDLNINLFVISVVAEERDIFYKYGISKDNLLDLHNPKIDLYDLEVAKNYIINLEIVIGMKVSEIVLMDRTLRLKDNNYVLKYLYHVSRSVTEFLEKNKIQIVFIEPTWTHEILISKICESFQIPVYAPVKDKILPNRFFMFKGYKHNELYQRAKDSNRKVIVNQAIKSIQEQDEKPQYFAQFNKRNKFTLSKFRVLFDITKLALLNKKNKNIQPPLLFSIKKKLFSIFKAYYFSIFSPFVQQEDINQKYILITLHVQPEASIDVVGVRFFDQVDFIRQIVRTTPISHSVIVKEHPHAFGDRPIDFYKNLLAMPGVQILNPFAESGFAIQNADLVISNTGTSSLEAAINGIPAVTATEMYFKELMVKNSFNPAVERVDYLLKEADLWRNNFLNFDIEKIMFDFQNNSFKGNSGDFKTDISVLKDENILNLMAAFNEVINSQVK